MPILYITQIMGLALGIAPDDLGLGALSVSAASVLGKITGKSTVAAGGKS
jgi:heterodisulfide reductase subunit B